MPVKNKPMQQYNSKTSKWQVKLDKGSNIQAPNFIKLKEIDAYIAQRIFKEK
jgi:hypothetical protein